MEVPKEWIDAMSWTYMRTSGCDLDKLMAAVATVCIEKCREKMLGPLTKEEKSRIMTSNGQCDVQHFLAHRRSLPLEEPKKTPEERTKVEFYASYWIVLLDGDNPASTKFNSEQDAKRYRRGLIAEIKEQEERSHD